MKMTLKTEPISLNLMYRGRRFWTKRGKDTKLGMQSEVALAWRSEPLEGDVALSVLFYFKDKRKRDIDSHLKCILDSLTGIVYKDDSQVDELHVYKTIDIKNPRVEIYIT